nr:MAG TPA: hypothetical protein [Caudoviricetes sp.]
MHEHGGSMKGSCICKHAQYGCDSLDVLPLLNQ